MASPASFYDVLGISMGASCQEIKSAYRKLARTYHPDVVAVNHKAKSANEFMKIHSAYSTLSDPDKRAQYDRQLCRYRISLEYSSLPSQNMDSMSGYHQRRAQAGHKWETDQLKAVLPCFEIFQGTWELIHHSV
ncbi:chaperone protein dnaJ 11, chloroplastic-like [Prosopis cineraria]|uniref:chaperone protein dnaJ 11, chloroplastic-like n=1 Tax=Prosopis cineraria TaxID=364024 RepID=UPI00241007F9|nr:chaperone protein dnaJ 11, chloroplastic-like [Prosopis cineraria]